MVENRRESTDDDFANNANNHAAPAQARSLPPELPPFIEVRAYRPSLQTKVGLRLKCRTNGLFPPSPSPSTNTLQPGMLLLSVNGEIINGLSHDAVLQRIAQTVGELRLVVGTAAMPALET